MPQKDIAKLLVQQSVQPNLSDGAAKSPDNRKAATPARERPSQGLYRIQPLDLITIRVLGTILDQPIDGKYLVEPDGRVALGPAYGRANVKGLTLEQAENAITRKLREVLQKADVQVTAAGKVAQWREAVLPKAPYTVAPGDFLFISVLGTILDQPIHGLFQVEPTGTVPLGPAYGRAQVQGLTLEGAEEAIAKKLREVLAKPDVQVTLPKPNFQTTTAAAGTIPWREVAPPDAAYTIKPGDLLFINVLGAILDQPIDSVYLVEPAGNVSLGLAYGRAKVQGLTLDAAEKAIQTKLQEVLAKPDVQVTFGGWEGVESMVGNRVSPMMPEFRRTTRTPRRQFTGPPIDSETINAGDQLVIQAAPPGSMEFLISGVFEVDGAGTVPLGPAYGRVEVAGLTRKEAQAAIRKRSRQTFDKAEVNVGVTFYSPARSLPATRGPRGSAPPIPK